MKFADELAPKFADSDEPTLESFTRGSIGWFIQRRIEDAAKPGARRLGYTHLYGLRRMQRAVIAKVKAEKLKPADLLDHCRGRKATGIKPATISQDVTYLRTIVRDYVESEELPQDAILAFAKARRKLDQEQLIGKSSQRDRLPNQEEIRLLKAKFAKQNDHHLTTTDMVLVVRAELTTGRRISEVCRIERQHVNVEERTCWIYDLKNSKGKGYNAKFALLGEAWTLFEERLAAIPNHPTARLFPFSSKTCSARYTLAKKELQKEHPKLFHNLRMHDNRAACFVMLLDKGYSPLQVRKGVSLHRNPNTFENVYARIRPEDLHGGPTGTPRENALKL